MTKEEIQQQTNKHSNIIINHFYNLATPFLETWESLLELRRLNSQLRAMKEKEAQEEKVGP